MASTSGRRVVVPLTNKSGGGVIAGDVVIVDTTNDEAFTTTTSAGSTGGVGIVQETIANNAVGRVLLAGYAALVNVSASVTRGHYGATHTVAKQAAGGASRGAGTFCQFLTGGTTPTARVFAPDLAAAAGNVAADAIWDAAGDLAVGTGADTSARLAKGTALQTLRVNSGATTLEWAATLGVWTTYTPTWATSGTPPALGDGSLVGRYKALDANTYLVNIAFTAGSTTTYGTGSWTFALPATAKNTANYRQTFAGHILDAGTDNKLCVGTINPNEAVVTPIPEGSNTVTNTTPHTWATTDGLTLSGILEV